MDPVFTPIVAAGVVAGAGLVGAGVTGIATVVAGAATLTHTILEKRKQKKEAKRNSNSLHGTKNFGAQGPYIHQYPQPYHVYVPVPPSRVHGNQTIFYDSYGNIVGFEPIVNRLPYQPGHPSASPQQTGAIEWR